MTRLRNGPSIVLIAVDSKIYEYLDDFIGNKYQVVAVDNISDFNLLFDGTIKNIYLFMIDTDHPWLGTQDLIKRIKTTQITQNIPIIGLALKKHFPDMPPEDRHQLEDILLLPCGNEDLLTRVELWARTYDIMCQNGEHTATFTMEDIKS